MRTRRRRRAALKVLAWALAAAGTLAAGWRVFVRLQGDSEVVYGSGELAGLVTHDGGLRGEVTLVNRGRQMAAILRVEGRVVEGPLGRVHVTRQGTSPPEPGFWVSNLLDPGESCVAEVDVLLDTPAQEPVVIELDVQEIGRRPLVHRRGRFTVPIRL
ncbi:MAG: hypothetical protein M3144_01690 [Actinomycetota bacterium]|nr:hypothetical protein [Actinomycetota bacterium]